MSLNSWLQNLRSVLPTGRGERKHARRDTHPVTSRRLNLEVLEDRSVPAFLAPFDYAVGTNPRAVVTADFNGDGRLDLATANYSSNDVSVLLGNGDGTLQTARNYATGGSPGCIAAGDFNGDGNLDLVTQDGNDYPNSGAIRVLLGNGDGSFQWISSSSTYAYPQGMAVGDFNGDGIHDVAASSSISNWAGDGASGELQVFLGDVNGSFSYVSGVGIGGYGSSPVTADFNRDGYADLAWDGGPEGPHGPVVVLLGAGNGTFEFVQSIELDAGAQTLAVADLNGDGNPDLVTDSNVLEGNGDGTFKITQNYAGQTFVGDFNGDGSLDLTVGNNLLPGNGNDARTFPAASGRWTLGDFNGDGRWDLVNANGYSANSVSVRLNDGIWDGPPSPLPPSLRIDDRSVTEGNAGTRDITFTVTLSFPSAEPVAVAYATAASSATAGSDYQAASGMLTFAPGETSKTISVLVNGDRLGEPDETFSVNISDPTNASIADASGQCYIYDDEPRISIDDNDWIGEGDTGTRSAVFTVSLSRPYDVPVMMDYATADRTATAGSDYQATSGTLTIPASQTSGTITVLVKGDRLGESNEVFFVNLSNLNYGVIYDGQGRGIVLDDEPRISISDVAKKEGNSNGKATLFTFTVTLSAAYDQPVTVSFRTADGTATASDNDYVARTGTITFLPGETTKTITIEVKSDHKKEANETFYLDLFDNGSNSSFTRKRGTGTILNDD